MERFEECFKLMNSEHHIYCMAKSFTILELHVLCLLGSKRRNEDRFFIALYDSTALKIFISMSIHLDRAAKKITSNYSEMTNLISSIKNMFVKVPFTIDEPCTQINYQMLQCLQNPL